jgi:hypothetical protein
MLYKIRLELARCKGYPNGADDIGYEFTAPLNDKGMIDAAAWEKVRASCRVVRFRPNEEDDVGHLVHKPGGPKGASWVFHYDIKSDEEDDEQGYRFADHAFRPGEYVSIREDDEAMPYKVKRVTPVN